MSREGTLSVPRENGLPYIPNYFPAAKLGGGNYFYVFNSGLNSSSSLANTASNYFCLSNVTAVSNAGGCAGCLDSNLGLTIRQAYEIDTKIDDGLAPTGNVRAVYVNEYIFNAPINATWISTACSQYGTGLYYVGQSSSENFNCALSFKMQAGD